MHIDVLREIGNIGAGNAATSLAMMLGQTVDMDVPNVRLLDFDEVRNAMGGAEAMTFGVLVPLCGDIDGMIMFLLDKDFAHLILNILMGEHYSSFDEMDEVAISAIQEVGNILSGAYVNSIADLAGIKIEVDVPSISVDMAGALLSVPIIRFGEVGDRVLLIEETFRSNQESVRSNMIMFAEIESLNFILGKLGIM
jgi:chemotaxis protein CheC